MPQDNSDHRQYVVARVTDHRFRVEVWSLVLSAVAIPSLIQRSGAGWHVLVPGDQLEDSNRELALFDQENANWPPPAKVAAVITPLTDHFPLVVFLMGCLMVFHGITGDWSANNHWFAAGGVAGRAVLENGEWWRLLTGLTLHHDPVHLLGNVLIGGFLLLFLCGRLGVGLGFSLTMTAGTLGNAFNVIWKGYEHLAVGYSTAVFGTVGILCGLEMKRGGTVRQLVVPLGAGLALLAMLGTEGEKTDIWAHWWGLLVGLLLGMGAAHLPGLLLWGRRPRVVAGLLLTGLGLVLGCWVAALAA
jgi:membrane associated rhomboid family serine protease